MSTLLLQAAYALDIEIWIENGALKYKAVKDRISPEFLQSLREHKHNVLNLLYQNETMKKAGWTSYFWGEMYTKRIRNNSDIFMFRESENSFNVWRGTWKSGQITPITEKDIILNASFSEAFKKAESYYCYVRA